MIQVGPSGNLVTQTLYDAFNNLVVSIDPRNLTTKYFYDKDNQLTQTIVPLHAMVADFAA